MPEQVDKNLNMTPLEIERIGHQFWMTNNQGNYRAHDVEYVKALMEFAKGQPPLQKKKVALMVICLNEHYWQYFKALVESARKFFMPWHDVDILAWSGIPEKDIQKDEQGTFIQASKAPGGPKERVDLPEVNSSKGINHFYDTVGVEWPAPTLMRYHLFLRQEEKLKEYDYLVYCDVDMLFVNWVGDEIFSPDLFGAQHPMYALREQLWFPYEPNPNSEAYFKQPGGYVPDPRGGVKFKPLYFAGGFQGGTSEAFIKAMKVMKTRIDGDYSKNYVARWNDESHWNRYCFENPPTVSLTPSYVYPDSLIEEYYVKIWGCNYSPKLITLTKKFSLSKEGGEAVQQLTQSL